MLPSCHAVSVGCGYRSLTAQMDALSTAWRWRSSDTILHTLPLHHIHGLVNALMCAHYNGALVEFAPFSGRAIWARLCQGDASVFMGVPSMYAHLLATYDAFSEEKQAACRSAAGALRLAVCGSAACPEPIMRAWQELAGEVRLFLRLSGSLSALGVVDVRAHCAAVRHH